MSTWTTANIPDLSEQIVVVTGATSGIGLWTAHGLAARGANVVLAVRNMARGQTAASEIRTAHPHARLSVAELDVSRLGSIAEFATRLAGDLPRLDVLVNNAGLGLQPVRSVTADTFALTARLIPLLLKAPAPLETMTTRGAHKRGRIHFDDLQAERSYSGIAVYSQSKLADLMFTLELARRCQEQGSRLASLAAHPGLSRTNFIKATALPRPVQAIMNGLFKVLGQDSQAGAWPSLYAAAMPDAVNGDYWGPGGFLELRGKPVRVKPAPRALDRAAWRQLWQVSEELTGVRFPALT
jgi:NAD(P)-dependent dehydrogenase (short-subunit alcohol dehydrogenase family)